MADRPGRRGRGADGPPVERGQLMALSSTHTSAASRSGSQGVVIEGLDVVVRDFTREAVTIRPNAEKVVVDYAAKAADRMRVLVPIDEGATLDSISSDSKATTDGSSVYADAGPE